MGSMFGEFLKQRRQEKSLTQKELANELGVSDVAISRWESELRIPNIEKISFLPRVNYL